MLPFSETSRSMTRRFLRYLKRATVILVVIALTLLAARVVDVLRGPPLQLWHKHAPYELSVKQLDGATWEDYLKAEQAAFEDVRTHVTDKLKPAQQLRANRYFGGSPLYPPHFQTDWNRSFILTPEGPPVGAVVLLHDTFASTVDLVAQFLPVLRANGYHLVTVSDLLGARAPGSSYGGRDNGPAVNVLQDLP